MINLIPIYINISGYRFTPINNIDDTLNQLKSLCANLDLKGSIYLATEGINIGLSGNILEIQTFLSSLSQDERFASMQFHELYSLKRPYSKMTVKTKTELVPIEDNTLKVGDFNHQYLPPLKLKEWLDNNEDFILLDMRNEFEFELGTFDKAQQLNLRRFRKLQTKADELNKLPKNKPIVTFCTGGIRCEKAAPYLEKLGFDQVFQLEGGIIEYLKQTRGAHWHGNCFVFDDRVSINNKLAPQHFNLCTDCQLILKENEIEFCATCLNNHTSQDAVI
tara:strand:+ start:442 stop:1272 length:831 start_codon:yes stop_codon:yes gene_type:complete